MKFSDNIFAIPLGHHLEIRKFKPCPNEIYLHGSRNKFSLIGLEIPENTDWDYAVPALYQTEIDKAIEFGWEVKNCDSYLDVNTATVLEKTINGEKIQVSSREHLPTYITIFESIPLDKYIKYLRPDKKLMADYLAVQYAMSGRY